MRHGDPFMPDRVVRRLLDGLPDQCFDHDGCKRCDPVLEKLVRGKRLEPGLAAERILRRLRELREEMGGTSRDTWEAPR